MMKENIIIEQWRDIKGYEGLYQVSNLGRVKSKERNGIFGKSRNYIFCETVLKPEISNAGYLRVNIYNGKKPKHHSVHRLVANAFLEKKSNQNVVDHINQDKKNNNVLNLRWCTQKENIGYFLKQFKRAGQSGSNAKLTDKDVGHIKSEIDKIKDINKNYVVKIAKGYGVSTACIYKIISNKQWAHIN